MGWVINATTRPLYSPPPGKETMYPLYRGLGWPQGRYGRVRKISPPTGIRSPGRPARSEALYWLSYPGPLYPTLYIPFTHSVHEVNKNRRPGWRKSRLTLVITNNSVVITAPVNCYVQIAYIIFPAVYYYAFCVHRGFYTKTQKKYIVKPCLLGSYLDNALKRAIKLLGFAELILITKLSLTLRSFMVGIRLRLKRDGTRAETRFRLSAKWTSPFKSVGASVQSTTDGRGVRNQR
jgi:hypothetical protein